MSRDFSNRVLTIGHALENSAGGYLRNTVRTPGVVCQVCSTPWPYGDLCNQCDPQSRLGHRLADRVASITYAPKRTLSGVPGQAYLALYGYKVERPQRQHVELIESLLGLGISGHMQCAHRLSGLEMFSWATVPSTRRPTLQHPLHPLVAARFRPGYEIEVRTVPGAQKLRQIQPENFLVMTPVPADTHVAVIDDSWVTGGSAQSVAIALRAVGAASISILTIGRVLGPEFGPNADFMRSSAWSGDFSFRLCPWTGGDCPS